MSAAACGLVAEEYQRFADQVVERLEVWHQEHEQAALAAARECLFALPFWPDLDERSRTFLATGEYLWADHHERELDVAAVCLEYAKVAEVELREWLERLRGVIHRHALLRGQRLSLLDHRSRPAPILNWVAGQSGASDHRGGEPSLSDIQLVLLPRCGSNEHLPVHG